jgi:NodT family efflux transporter outer membrane factor (OMF) lipoprotein
MQHIQPPEHQIYNGGLSVSYDLDLFGGIRRGVEAATAEDEAAVAARDLVRINVAAQTAQAYADACNAGHEIADLGQLIRNFQENLRLTRLMIAHGRAPKFEEDRQQGLLESTRSRLPKMEARQRNAVFRIATLIGRVPAEFDHSLLGCNTPLVLRTPTPIGDGRALLKRRPDVRAAERRLAAATARIGIATAALYPDIRLGASLGSTGAAADLLSPLTNRFGIGPLISWNLHRSTVRARIAQSEARTRANLAAFDGTVLSALREVESALNIYAADLERLEDLKRARDNAVQVSERTTSLRRGGKVGSLSALDAQRSWVIAQQAVTAAQSDINRDQIALFLALGGGWAVPSKQ